MGNKWRRSVRREIRVVYGKKMLAGFKGGDLNPHNQRRKVRMWAREVIKELAGLE